LQEELDRLESEIKQLKLKIEGAPGIDRRKPTQRKQ